MSWTYKHKKLRDTLRQAFTEETGLPYTSPEFEKWLKANRHL